MGRRGGQTHALSIDESSVSWPSSLQSSALSKLATQGHRLLVLSPRPGKVHSHLLPRVQPPLLKSICMQNTCLNLLSFLLGCQGMLCQLLSVPPSILANSACGLGQAASTSSSSTRGSSVFSPHSRKATDTSCLLPRPFPKCQSPVIAAGLT